MHKNTRTLESLANRAVLVVGYAPLELVNRLLVMNCSVTHVYECDFEVVPLFVRETYFLYGKELEIGLSPLFSSVLRIDWAVILTARHLTDEGTTEIAAVSAEVIRGLCATNVYLFASAPLSPLVSFKVAA